MKYLRNRRGLAGGLGALAAVIGVTLWVVLPALASSLSTGYTGPAQAPASERGVMPVLFNTGGQPNDCGLFAAYEPTPNPATDSYLVKNINKVNGKWVSVTDSNNKTVKIKESEDSTKTYATVDIQGGLIYDIGIDGGSGTDWYNYTGQTTYTGSSSGTNLNLGGVAHDGTLHTTLKSSGPFNLSQTMVCYAPTGVVSGTVYNDLNQDGSYDSTPSPADTPLPGWQVTLWDTTPGSPPSQVGSATSGSDGSYAISVFFTRTDSYTVCETPSSADASTDWVQSEPRPTSGTCGPIDSANPTLGALPNGGTFTASTDTDAVTQNFGNVSGDACIQPMTFPDTTGATLDMLMPGSSGCEKSQTFAFHSATDQTGGPDNGKLFVNLLVGNSALDPVPVVEKITFPDPLTAGGLPTYTGLQYTTAFPVTSSTVPQDMQSCQVDPRDSSNSSAYGGSGDSTMYLSNAYIDYTTSGTTGSYAVLPAGQTSCVISLTITGTAPDTSGGASTGTLVAYVYSTVDTQFYGR